MHTHIHMHTHLHAHMHVHTHTQVIGYDCLANIWSLGITAVEFAEGRPPYAKVHSMRAIFMISTKPSPTLKDQEGCSAEFQDFIA